MNIPKQTRQNAALLLGSFCVALIVSELGLRNFLPQSTARLGAGGPGLEAHPPHMFVRDENSGYALTPGFAGLFVRSEYQTPVHINALGLRGPELRERTVNSFRILAVGDSFTWGYGTTETEAWPNHLETLLNEQYPTLDIQVLNAGVPGYGNDEELSWLRARGDALAPDLVIAMFFAGNDFEDNKSHARDTHDVVDGMLWDKSYREKLKSKPLWLRIVDVLKVRSHLFSFVSDRLGYLSMRFGLFATLTNGSSENFSETDARNATDLLSQIVTTARSFGAQTLLVFAPDKMQVLGDTQGELRAAQVVADAAEIENVPWLDLTYELRAPENRDRMYYLVDGHWTAAGNEITAQTVFDMIVENGIIADVRTEDR